MLSLLSAHVREANKQRRNVEVMQSPRQMFLNSSTLLTYSQSNKAATPVSQVTFYLFILICYKKIFGDEGSYHYTFNNDTLLFIGSREHTHLDYAIWIFLFFFYLFIFLKAAVRLVGNCRSVRCCVKPFLSFSCSALGHRVSCRRSALLSPSTWRLVSRTGASGSFSLDIYCR